MTFYSTVNDHTELAFAVVKRNDQIHRPREPYLGCCRFSFWSVEKHIAPRLWHVLAMSAPGRPEGANTRTTRNRHLRVLIQFATKWSLTLQVLSYVGGKNCKVFRLPKFWRMKNKVCDAMEGYCFGRRRPKKNGCEISNFGADENVGLLSRKEDRPHQNFLAAPKDRMRFSHW